MRYESFYPFARNQSHSSAKTAGLWLPSIFRARHPPQDLKTKLEPWTHCNGQGPGQSAQGQPTRQPRGITGQGPSKMEAYMQTANQFLNTAQQFAPVVQQFAPMMRNLPAMWKLYKGFQSIPASGGSTNRRR